ncbi:multidrug resistance-associated ABC transporter [Mycena floridula]|nr:multidrug resistance-associated ABC transporter [Mycena floridula]
MGLCNAGPFEFADPCIRASWTTILPAALVLALAILTWSPIQSPLVMFLTVPEAEALEINRQNDPAAEIEPSPLKKRLRPSNVFVFIGLVEALCWLAIGLHHIITIPHDIWGGLRPIIVAFSWSYTVARPTTSTAPLDLFSVYCIQLATSLINDGVLLYEHLLFATPTPSILFLSAISVNLVIIAILLIIVLNMPLTVPSRSVKQEDIGHNVSPEDYTTLWQWIIFSWIYPLIEKGRDKTLGDKDIWPLSITMQSHIIFVKFISIYHSSLLHWIWRANSLDIIVDFILKLTSVMLAFCVPYFLQHILEILDREDQTREDRFRAYIYAALMFVFSVARPQVDLQQLWFSRRAATRTRSELMAAVYDKALKMRDYSGIIDQDNKGGKKNEPRAGANIGKIVNIMSSDVSTISEIFVSLSSMYGAPLELLFGGVYLYRLLGWSMFVGFFALFLVWPVNNYLTKRSGRINKSLATSTDKRMSVLNELLGAVKFIKFFAWEDHWIDRTLNARELEMQWMVKSRVNNVILAFVWIGAPIFISVASFFSYIARGNQMTISVAFTAVYLFSMIKSPLNVIPSFIVKLVKAKVSLKRIELYLNEEEVAPEVSSLKTDLAAQVRTNQRGIGLVNATLKWNEVDETKDEAKKTNASGSQSDIAGDRKFELRDISVVFPEGELSIITGPTASGKTALLMALLGEMTILDGHILLTKNTSQVNEHGLMHAISYASQLPWLQHRSIKDNIVFGNPYDEDRYDAVVKSCALLPDLKVLEDGDATEIGIRGVSLSGGQKARVALARAVYARTQYVLLDDPLSAVDSHTSRFLYENLLRGPLLANRTVIMVTHHVDLVLEGAHYMVRMLDGRIDSQGTIKDLRAQGILEDIWHETEIHDSKILDQEVIAVKGSAATKKPRKLIEAERQETGSVKWSVYKQYLKAGSYWIWGLLLVLVIVLQVVLVLEKLWIKIWGEAYGNDASRVQLFDILKQEILHENTYFTSHKSIGINWPDASEHPMFYVAIYAAIGMSDLIFRVTSRLVQITGGLWASQDLFRKLLVNVVRATFRFHDTTPQGRMLNRFSKDMQTIDVDLPQYLQATGSSLAIFFASVVTISVIYPLFLIPASFMGVIYYRIAMGYLHTGRDLRRMDSNTRSPIFSDFQEMLEGIVTVRAFSAENRFLQAIHQKIDAHTKVWYTLWLTNRWLLWNYEFLGQIGVLIAAIFSIYNSSNGAGLAALCISSALSFTSSMYTACLFWTNLELNFNAVERVIEYTSLPQEPVEGNRPPAYWPSVRSNDALISVENVTVKYAPDLPAVLHDVSFTLKAGERVGLLGRTGSGKSTLAMTLLRFVDPVSGRILIDGIDISTIGLYDLRSRLTFIPQDATLFSGTLRDNLDPFNEHEDSECLEALYRVQMISSGEMAVTPVLSGPASIHNVDLASDNVSTTTTEVDSKLTVSLDTQVSAGGNNFSQGQRQLIAMARALLRNTSVIIMDEATSSIDFETDKKIQETIQEQFKDSLLLTVAHRLWTIIDYDRLVVLDQGKVVEVDTPFVLIQKENGVFRDMCLKSGAFDELFEAAKAKAEGHRIV